MHVLTPAQWDAIDESLRLMDFIDPFTTNSVYTSPEMHDRQCVSITGSTHAGYMFVHSVADTLVPPYYRGDVEYLSDLVWAVSQRLRIKPVSSHVYTFYLPHVVVAGRERRPNPMEVAA